MHFRNNPIWSRDQNTAAGLFVCSVKWVLNLRKTFRLPISWFREHLKILRELWAIHRSREESNKANYRIMALRWGGQSLFVSAYMCVYMYACKLTVAVWGRFQKSSASLMWFPLRHSNLSRPHPGTLVSRDCEGTVFTEHMNDAGKPSHLQGALSARLSYEDAWVFHGWGALEGSAVSCLEAPHPACLRPHIEHRFLWLEIVTPF